MQGSLYANDLFPIGQIDQHIHSSLLEHMGRSIYGGVYDPDSPLADEAGLRRDVMAAVKELNVPLVRYPGGNFVSSYHWEDGIGPRSQRPQKVDLAWQSVESNQFGLDDFMDWTEKVGAAPMIAVNLGTRGIEDACNLLEYCNLDTDTYWANQRRQNGHEQPYHVTYWCLGNEMDAEWQIGHKTAHEYGQLVNETAKAMRRLDPSIKLIVCGSSNEHTATFGQWELAVLAECYDNVDYVSMHQYYELPSQGIGHHLAKSLRMDKFINSVVALCDAAKAVQKSDKTLNISFDEWNVWYHSNAHDAKQIPWQQAPHQLEDDYNFADALLVGSSLITLLKHADRVKIACFAQLVNVIAPILITQDGLVKQTIFPPLRDAAKYGHGTVLRTNVQSPTYQAPEFGDVPYLDAVIIKNADRHYTVFAVNRSETAAIQLAPQINATDLKETSHLSYQCADPDFKNSATQTVTEETVTDNGQIELAPFSWNVLTFEG